MSSLCVLITNLQIKGRSGTELYVYDLAISLQKMGHRPVIFTSKMGPLAESLLKRSIPVLDSLRDLQAEPDLIHGHHHLETMSAILRFPNAPGIFVCHDSYAWHDRAPRFPRIYRYVAVDNACHDRLHITDGIPAAKITTIQNGVDLHQFRPRPRLPRTPRRALLISNYATAKEQAILAKACRSMGIELDAAGRHFGRSLQNPGAELVQYDIVFAKGRCAWEALAVGASVVVCDADFCGPMVTSDNLQRLAQCNFGRRSLSDPITVSRVTGELQKYDADDAEKVSSRIRERADMNVITEQLVTLYQEVITEHANVSADVEGELLAASDYLHWWSANQESRIKEGQRKYRPDMIVGRFLRQAKHQAMRTLKLPRSA